MIVLISEGKRTRYTRFFYLMVPSLGLLEPIHRYLFPNSVSLMKIEETSASAAVPAVNQNTVFSACSY